VASCAIEVATLSAGAKSKNPARLVKRGTAFCAMEKRRSAFSASSRGALDPMMAHGRWMVALRPVCRATDSMRCSPAHLDAVKPSEPSVGGCCELTDVGGTMFLPDKSVTRFDEMKWMGMRRGSAN